MRTGEIVDNKMDAETEKALAAFGAASVRRRPNAMLTTKELSDAGVTRVVMPDIASQYDKMEDCILFLRVNKLISEGDVSRIRRRMEAKMAKPSNDPSSATRPTGRHDCNRDAQAGFAAAHG